MDIILEGSRLKRPVFYLVNFSFFQSILCSADSLYTKFSPSNLFPCTQFDDRASLLPVTRNRARIHR